MIQFRKRRYRLALVFSLTLCYFSSTWAAEVIPIMLQGVFQPEGGNKQSDWMTNQFSQDISGGILKPAARNDFLGAHSPTTSQGCWNPLSSCTPASGPWSPGYNFPGGSGGGTSGGPTTGGPTTGGPTTGGPTTGGPTTGGPTTGGPTTGGPTTGGPTTGGPTTGGPTTGGPTTGGPTTGGPTTGGPTTGGPTTGGP